MRHRVLALPVLAVLWGSLAAGGETPSGKAAVLLSATAERPGKLLIIGPGSAGLALEACRANPALRVYAVEPDAAARDQGRRTVDDAGLYGRATVHACARPEATFAPLYFDTVAVTLPDAAPSRASVAWLYRLLRPGGRALFFAPAGKGEGWQRYLATLGLQTEVLPDGGACLSHARPGPNPARDYRSWFGGPLHQNASDNPDFKPPLVEVWNVHVRTANAHVWVAPIVGDGVVVIHELRFHAVIAHDAYTGEMLWRFPSSFPENVGVHKRKWLSIPAVVGGAALVATSLDELTCIDLKTGAARWKKPIPVDMDWDVVEGAQAIREVATHQGKFYLVVNKDKALLMDPRTGEEETIPPLLPHRAYARSGKLLFYPELWNYQHRPMKWRVEEEGTGRQVYGFESPGRMRFCIAEELGIVIGEDWTPHWGLDLATGKPLWTGHDMPWTCSGPTYAGGYTWSTASGVTYAQDARDGRLAWMERGANSCVPPAIANGILYTMSNNTMRLRALASERLFRLPAENGD